MHGKRENEEKKNYDQKLNYKKRETEERKKKKK